MKYIHLLKLSFCKIFSPPHWDKFIYGLLYPGFVGSMFYELIPPDKENFNWRFLDLAWQIKFAITAFYILDYFHLYGDMHEAIEEDKRDTSYLICDIFSSVGFFAAFFFVKVEHSLWALLAIAVVPLFFLYYKRRNKYDRRFYFPYVITSVVVGITFFALFSFEAIVLSLTLDQFLFYFTWVSFLIYLGYYLVSYEWFSKAEDAKIYKKELLKNLTVKRIETIEQEIETLKKQHKPVS